MQVWRICRERHADAAFSGEGARLYGARWNPRGIPLAYCADSRALAVLEFFVNMNPLAPASGLVMCSAEISGGIQLEQLHVANLPADWRELDNPELKNIGAEWLTSGRSVALKVPSAVVPGDWNVLLNPAHPAFAKVKIGTPELFSFDVRMFKR